MFTEPESGEVRNGIMRVRYTADAMIDHMIVTPAISQNELASIFGYSPAWVSQVVTSDAFQSRLAERRTEIIDPILIRSVEERFRSLAQRSLDILMEKLDNAPKDGFVLECAKLSTAAMGYGARAGGPLGGGGVTVAVVVQVPQKIQSERDWAARHATPMGDVEDAAVRGVQSAHPNASQIVDHETAKVFE